MKSVPTARRRAEQRRQAPPPQKPSNDPPGFVAAVAVVLLFGAILNLNIPYFALKPGPTEDVTRLTKIEGVETHRVNGRILLTTVSLKTIRVAEAVWGWVDPAIAIVSRSAIIPSGDTEQDVQLRTTEQMEESQVLAAASALTLLGYEVTTEAAGVRVLDVAVDVPAAGVIHRGDIIVEADGRPMKKKEDLVAEIHRRGVGQTVRLHVLRGKEKLDITVTTIGKPQDPKEPVIGVVIDTLPQVKLPLAIDIDSRGIGGPSAGLMFAVGIVDLLDERDLTKGRVIAGTGEIQLGGLVTAVGGIQQKVEAAKRAKADLFLVPEPELKQACSIAGDLSVVAVADLRQAVDALEGKQPPADRRCA